METNPLFAEERKQKIVDLVTEKRKATVDELCLRFSVSAATIRNDLRDLEQQGLLLRTHGGAMMKTKTALEPTSNQKEVRNLQAKKAIARAALALIEDGDTIILDTGSTTVELARILGNRNNITVITNDIAIAMMLEGSEKLNVLIMGGLLRRNFHCTVGAPGISMLSAFSVDKAFMGANGFSLAKGATTPDMNHAETKKAMMAIASKVVLLCDSSKLEQPSFAQFAPAEAIDTLVTEAIDGAARAQYEEAGIEVIVAG
ncbi:MAG: DeoR/GlpR transcriptional regulator [Spirochaetales bacterium]|nr:MAG: DeoR/GlpR transcriptional regulator [Spirochaetales bacterium]